MNNSSPLDAQPRASELKLTSESRIVVGFCLAVILIIAVVAASLLGISRLRDDSNWVSHTYKVIAALEDVLSLATDTETAGRGYVITGDAQYLKPYTVASDQISVRLGQLKDQIRDNPEQVQAVADLSQLVERRLKLIEKLIDQRDEAGFDAAQAFILSGEGMRAHDAIRRQVAEMQKREDALLLKRMADTERSTRLAILSVALGGVLAIAVACLALYLIRRDYSGSRRAHAALGYLNAALDAKVAERTSELLKANDRLKLTEAVFQNTQEYVVITDLNCNIIASNPAFSKITEYSAEEVVGQQMRLLQSGRHDRSFYLQMWNAILTTGQWQGEIWNRRKSGDIYKEWLAINVIPGDDGQPAYYIGVGTDLSRMNRVETDLEYMAHHDALTGLPNRLLLMSRLGHTLERSKRDNSLCAVIFLDLDRFKAVNDTLGHAAGDELLRLATERMTERLRDVDTLARLGGDEFVIVMEGLTSPEGAIQVVEAIIERLNLPFIVCGDKEVRIGTSAGICFYPRDADNPADLLDRADQALYEAKRAGRNTWRESPQQPIGH